MTHFSHLLKDDPNAVVDRFYQAGVDMFDTSIEKASHKFQLAPEQLIIALGFNPDLDQMLDVIFTLGMTSLEDFLAQRDSAFIHDTYKRLSQQEITSVYESLQSKKTKHLDQLLWRRIQNLEKEIEKTVRPSLIESYRNEMKTIYALGLPSENFVNFRIKNKESGFRAMIDEVSLIVDAGYFSAEALFLNESILANERRKMIARGLISEELRQERLKATDISDQEKIILQQ